MTTSEELFLSILSMDSYNRGYGAGIGNANIGLGEAGSLGNVRVLARSDDIDLQEWQAAGFYAVAYEVTQAVAGFSAGDVIISYRGTDGLNDVWNGWTSIVGVIPVQAALAAQFHNAVRASSDLGTKIILTGHSLGGALAGFVGSIHGEESVLFDNIAFETVSNRVSQAAVEAYENIEDQVAASSGTEAEKEELRQQLLEEQRSVIGDYYGKLIPSKIENRDQIKTLAVPGEVAEGARAFQSDTRVIAVGSQSFSENRDAVPDPTQFSDLVGPIASETTGEFQKSHGGRILIGRVV